jgi:hypothetical protein
MSEPPPNPPRPTRSSESNNPNPTTPSQTRKTINRSRAVSFPIQSYGEADNSDRHSAERKGWHREMKALVTSRDREIAAGKRPRKGLELNVGYHQELEASNKRLEMDNRLMAPRVSLLQDL